MLFCKSSTVKVGTIELICTASCVVATIASSCFVCFVHPQASGLRPDLQARPCDRSFAETDEAGQRSPVQSETWPRILREVDIARMVDFIDAERVHEQKLARAEQ